MSSLHNRDEEAEVGRQGALDREFGFQSLGWMDGWMEFISPGGTKPKGP